MVNFSRFLKKSLPAAAVVAAMLLIPATGCAQQQVDNEYTPQIAKPLYRQGEGPVLMIDAGHFNFHTLDDKFAPFGKIASLDGFKVKRHTGSITGSSLSDVRILVIANALHEENTERWAQPVLPAFKPEEVEHILEWVRSGGRLFLIADHMPFPGAVASLAKAFGFEFYDGFAMRRPRRNFDQFTRANGMLTSNRLTELHGPLDSIVSFTGQAFRIPEGATSVITMDSSYKILMPEVAWEFNDEMKILPAEGLSQLAYRPFGAGKVVISGEAVMFTAQRVGDVRIGIHASFAPYNLQLLLNILEWLDE